MRKALTPVVAALVALPALALGYILYSTGATERAEFGRTADLTAQASGVLRRLAIRKEARPDCPWGGTYVIALRYESTVQGRRYEGNALRDAFLRGRLREVRPRVEPYAPSAKALVSEGELRIERRDVAVFYDPRRPERSAAYLGGTVRSLTGALVFEIAGGVLAVFGVLLALVIALAGRR